MPMTKIDGDDEHGDNVNSAYNGMTNHVTWTHISCRAI